MDASATRVQAAWRACVARARAHQLRCVIEHRERGALLQEQQLLLKTRRLGYSPAKRPEGAACPARCIVEGAGASRAIVPVRADFTILAVDGLGQAKRRGGDVFKVVLTGPSSAKVTAKDCGDGRYICSYTLAISGRYTLDVRVRNSPLLQCPRSLLAVSGSLGIYAPACVSNGVATSRSFAGTLSKFTISANDMHANALTAGGDQLTAFLSPAHWEANMANTCLTIQSCGGRVCVSSGDRIHKVDWMTSRIPAVGCKLEVMPFTDIGSVRLSDGSAFVNPASPPPDWKSGLVEPQILDQGDGTYVLQFRIDNAGYLYNLWVCHCSPMNVRSGAAMTDIADSPFQIHAASGMLHAASCRIHAGTGVKAQETHAGTDEYLTCVAGESAAFELHTRDVFGNIGRHGEAVALRLVNKKGVFLEGSDCSLLVFDRADRSGVYDLDITCMKSGLFHLQVMVSSGAELVSSGDESNPLYIRVEAADLDMSVCSAAGDGLLSRQVISAVPGVFTITARDQYGNAVTNPERLNVGVSISGTHSLPVAMKDGGNGGFACSFTREITGDFVIDITLNSRKMRTPFPVSIIPAGTDPSKCCCSGSALQGGVVGVEYSLFIKGRDLMGNDRASGGDKWLIHSSPPLNQVSYVDHNNGSYTAIVTPREAAMHAVSVLLVEDTNAGGCNRDGKVAGCPFMVDFQAEGVSATRRTTVLGSDMHEGIVGDVCVFTICSRDRFGNQRTAGGDKYSIDVHGLGDHNILCSISDQQNGTYNVEYSPRLAGRYCLNVTQQCRDGSSLHVGGSPFTSSVVEPQSTEANAIRQLRSIHAQEQRILDGARMLAELAASQEAEDERVAEEQGHKQPAASVLDLLARLKQLLQAGASQSSVAALSTEIRQATKAKAVQPVLPM